MRILHVIDNYAPAPGGKERFVRSLAAAQADAGDLVRVATLARPDSPEQEWDGAVDVHRLTGFTKQLGRFSGDASFQFHPTMPDPLLVRRLREQIEEFRPDIVHAHGWILHSCLALRLPQRTKLVVTLHDYGLTCATMTRQQTGTLDVACSGPAPAKCLRCAKDFYGAAKGVPLTLGLTASRRSLAKVAMFIPVSRSVQQLALPDVSADRVRVIPPFLPDSIAGEGLGDRPAFLPDGDFLLFVGALGPHKGLDTLLAAHRRMAADVPLVLIGPRRVDTPAIADIDGRPVSVHSDLPHPQIMAAFRAATVSVVPSRWSEPFGLVALEAMVAGSPVVASAIGALPDVLAGDAGELVPPGDVDALACTLDRLLADPARRAELAANGDRQWRRFTEDTVVPQVREAYAAALGRLHAVPDTAGV